MRPLSAISILQLLIFLLLFKQANTLNLKSGRDSQGIEDGGVDTRPILHLGLARTPPVTRRRTTGSSG
ncbi:hypothetical protein HWI79_3396, partial [Cryptosporidium felis]